MRNGGDAMESVHIVIAKAIEQSVRSLMLASGCLDRHLKLAEAAVVHAVSSEDGYLHITLKIGSLSYGSYLGIATLNQKAQGWEPILSNSQTEPRQ